MKYLFVYKTTHKNGRYYIGKHETTNINDGYLGSGNWVRSVVDKTELTREIIAEASSQKELYALEEYYIDLHFDDPLNMNYKRASVGLTSDDAKELAERCGDKWATVRENPELNNKRLENLRAKHNEQIAAGTFIFTQPDHMKKVAEINRQLGKQRMMDGTSSLLRPEAKAKAKEKLSIRIEELTEQGKWGFQNREVADKVNAANRELIMRGEFHTQTKEFAEQQSKTQRDLVKSGTHMTQAVWTCEHCGTTGKGMSNYSRYHGDNCTVLKPREPRPKTPCPECGELFAANTIGQHRKRKHQINT